MKTSLYVGEGQRLVSCCALLYVRRITSLQDVVTVRVQVNVLVTELKSEALKERHWKQLMKKLNVNWMLHDLTLGQVGVILMAMMSSLHHCSNLRNGRYGTWTCRRMRWR